MDEARARMLTSLNRPGGAVAQLGARLDGIEEVVGSNPIGSTKIQNMSYELYILQSQSTNRYYIGQIQDFQKRLTYHNANCSKALRIAGLGGSFTQGDMRREEKPCDVSAKSSLGRIAP